MSHDVNKAKDVTLLFLRRDGEILLAMKKRRFGAGKWNGVGGKVEPGETIEQAAIRECQEEIMVTPNHLERVGELYFEILPDIRHRCHIYQTAAWEGDPQETEEMNPRWFHEDAIPYDTMWPDDKFWLPLLLANKQLSGTVVIENNQIIRCDISEVDAL